MGPDASGEKYKTNKDIVSLHVEHASESNRPTITTTLTNEDDVEMLLQSASSERVVNDDSNGCSRDQCSNAVLKMAETVNAMPIGQQPRINFDSNVEEREYVPEVCAETLDWFNGRAIKLRPLSTCKPKAKSFDTNQS